MKVKVIQLCLALCNPMDYTVYGILQARILIFLQLRISSPHWPNPSQYFQVKTSEPVAKSVSSNPCASRQRGN